MPLAAALASLSVRLGFFPKYHGSESDGGESEGRGREGREREGSEAERTSASGDQAVALDAAVALSVEAGAESAELADVAFRAAHS